MIDLVRRRMLDDDRRPNRRTVLKVTASGAAAVLAAKGLQMTSAQGATPVASPPEGTAAPMEEIASPMAAAQFAYVGSNSRAQIVDGTPVADPVGITVFAVDPATGALSSDPDRVQRHRLLFRLRCRSDASLCGQRDRRLRWRHERLGRSLCPRSRNRHAHLPQPGRFRRWPFGPDRLFLLAATGS